MLLFFDWFGIFEVQTIKTVTIINRHLSFNVLLYFPLPVK